MKNRLEITREFLRDDGVIFVQCDDNEQAYLKVLMDEIFGRENFVGCLAWLKGNTQNDAKTIQKNHEHILCYARDIQAITLYKIKSKEEVKIFKDFEGNFYYEGYGLSSGSAEGGRLENRPSLGYSVYFNPSTQDFMGVLDYDTALARDPKNHANLYQDNLDLLQKGYIIIRPPKMGAGLGRWTWALDKFNANKKEILIKSSKAGYSISIKKFIHARQVKQNEDGDYYALIERENPPKSILDAMSSAGGTRHLNKLFGDRVFANSKPEALLKRIIEISTQEGDLVLDFFAGSGTTLAVAHKMRRRWIGIEQMDYIETITKERLKKVIAGEQGGVSKAVGWNGGGGFIYGELMPLNALYKEKIEKSSDESELEKIYQDLESKAFLDYRVDLQEILRDQDFKDLNLENKKEVLKAILDSNMDYLPYGEIKDASYQVSKETIALNEIFYGSKK